MTELPRMNLRLGNKWLCALIALAVCLVVFSHWALRNESRGPNVVHVTFPPGFSKIRAVEVDSTSYPYQPNFKNPGTSNGLVFLHTGGLIEVLPTETPSSQVPGQLKQGTVYLIEKIENVHGKSREPGFPPEDNVLLSYVTLLGPNGARFECGGSEFRRESKVSMLTVFKPSDTPEFQRVKAKYELQSAPVANIE